MKGTMVLVSGKLLVRVPDCHLRLITLILSQWEVYTTMLSTARSDKNVPHDRRQAEPLISSRSTWTSQELPTPC